MDSSTGRTITPEKREDDSQYDTTLRPRSFDDYIGQEKIKGNLRLFIDALHETRERRARPEFDETCEPLRQQVTHGFFPAHR